MLVKQICEFGCDAQIRFPSYSVVQVTLRDLRGSSSNASGCAYQLYVYRPGSANNVYREWCATRQSASAWQQTFYLWYTDTHGRSQVVDVVFSRNAASATGAVWIEFEGSTRVLVARRASLIVRNRPQCDLAISPFSPVGLRTDC